MTYRSRFDHACYVTRVDKDNIPGLDTIAKTFQHQQVSTGHPTQHRLGQDGAWGAHGNAPGTVRRAHPPDEELGCSITLLLPHFFFLLSPRQAEKRLAMPLADRFLLGTTASILCSIVPVYWA